MGHMYSVDIISNTISTTKSLFHINGITNGIVVLHSVFVGQSSDAGDAAAEMLRIQISRSTSNSTAVGTAATPRPHLLNDQAYGGTVRLSNTYSATNVVLINEAFNVQAGWYYTPTPEERIIIPPKSVSGTHPSLRVDLPNAPSDALSVQGRMTFEVIN
jgi:hypothetical protein